MLSEKQKHGVLAFDEIMLRESLGVNSNTLTYSGLENLGNDLSSNQTGIEMKANHGLVFVFQSLGANFCQPIGVFAAKGSVKGIYIFNSCKIMQDHDHDHLVFYVVCSLCEIQV